MIDYDPIALMEENIMHSMSQQHFPPGTADSKESSQTLCRIPLLSWESGLPPPIPAGTSPWDGLVLVWLMYGSMQGSFEVKRDNSTQCAAEVLGNWCRRRKGSQSQKFRVPVHVPVIGSFKMRSSTELATGGCYLIQLRRLIWGHSVKKTVSVKLYVSCKI